MERLWHRVLAQQPVPSGTVVLLTGLVALVLVLAPATWPRVRMGVTIVHEAGHAAVAVLVGRRLSGIRLHSDTSGVTVTRGRPRGPGMVATLLAGYLAPAALGLGAALLLAAGHSVALLGAVLVVLVLILLWVRNAYGVLAVLVTGTAIALVGWYATPTQQSVAAYLLAWLLLLAAPRPLVELLTDRRRPATSDPDQVARLTHVPALLWILLMLAANLAGLVVGAGTLAPRLL
ncbi:MAG: M50 family metallopeptidase [Nocardioides sp.]